MARLLSIVCCLSVCCLVAAQQPTLSTPTYTGTSIAGDASTPVTTTLAPKPLPTLPNDPLQINVEATIYRRNLTSGVIKQYSEYVQEYRDPGNSQGLAIITNGSLESRFYYDLANKEGMTLTRDTATTPLNQASCTVTKLDQPSTVFGGFSIETQAGQLIISNISSFFAWGAERRPKYLGSDNIRGIAADKWLVILPADSMSINLTYYFSAGHQMPYYGVKAIPLRIVMVGSRTYAYGTAQFNHVYDFGLIAPLGDKGENFFSTPRGVHCRGRNSPSSVRHEFADQYTVSEEVIDRGTTVITNSKVYFDYTLQLTRTDKQVGAHDKYNYSNIKVIHDFNQNYEMVIVKENGTCHVTNIPTSGGISMWDVSVKDGKPTLYHTKDLPWTQDLQFQGYRVEKGIPVSVWSGESVTADNTVSVQEMWYAAPNWRVRASQAAVNSYNVIVGFYYLSYNSVTHVVGQQLQSNTYNQYYGPLKEFANIAEDVFDAQECYNRDSTALSHLNMRLMDTEGLFLKNQVSRSEIARAVRASLSDLAKISPTRFTDIQVYDERVDKGSSSIGALIVYFTLREKLLLDSASISEVVQDEMENAKVVTLLEAELATAKGLVIPVTALDGHSASFKVISLLSNDEGSLSEELGGSSGVKTYSAASMAGLGVGMILLGAVLTLAVGAVAWIKRFDINLPYVSQTNE